MTISGLFLAGKTDFGSMFFAALGGFGLFLYGMWMLRSHLEAAAGERLSVWLRRLTKTTLRGFFAGTVITAAVQSSSAVTVLLVGFVDAGIMTLQQAVGVILGVNIGTTITGQLIACDIGKIAPLLAFLGIICLLFFKKKQWQETGGVLAGMGVMFIGLNMLGEALLPLGETAWAFEWLAKCKSPFWGILAGTVFAAVLQSSSASVGILQTLAQNGIVNAGQCLYVVCGQNIGTCITALIASIGTGKNAKRTAVIHLLINVLGTVFFLVMTSVVPVMEWIADMSPFQPARQIANLHTFFNVVTSLLLLPFGKQLVWLAGRMVQEQSNHDKMEM